MIPLSTVVIILFAFNPEYNMLNAQITFVFFYIDTFPFEMIHKLGKHQC